MTQVLRRIAPPLDARIIVGPETRDDAAVVQLAGDQALILTTDFFAPVVDDPFDFGRIAAANALSDVYAMGGQPHVALNIVAFPTADLPISVLGDILEGGAETVRRAGALVLGGHSVVDAELKYGLCVLGQCRADRVWTNANAKPRDRLVLTKPLGSGILTTAIKRELATSAETATAIDVMAELNRDAAGVLARYHPHVHAVTDVTGFGLAGHLFEMLDGSRVNAQIFIDALKWLPGVDRLAALGTIPQGSHANWESYAGRVDFDAALASDATLPQRLGDPQTSGGLLAAVAPEHASAVTAALRDSGVDAFEIGEITTAPAGINDDGEPVRIRLTP